MTKAIAYTPDTAGQNTKTMGAGDPVPNFHRAGIKPRHMMITRTCLLLLSTAFFIGGAAAQTPSRPIVNGRQPQPSQEEVDRRGDSKAREWNRRVQPELDRLYYEIMGVPAPRRR
jgi:hypothetical protein